VNPSRQKPPKPRTEKIERQRDQRRTYRDRLVNDEVRRRFEQPDVLPVRDDEGSGYRP